MNRRESPSEASGLALPAPVAVVAALAEELRPLRRHLIVGGRVGLHRGRAILGRLGGTPVALAVIGDGPTPAARGLLRVLETVDPGCLLLLGVAGGLSPDLEVGEVVVAQSIHNGTGAAPAPSLALPATGEGRAAVRTGAVFSSPKMVIEARDKARLWEQSGRPGCQVVDLESAVVARLAAERNLPFAVVRAVSDRQDEDLPLDFNAFRNSRGALDRHRVLRHALRHPALMRRLLGLRGRVRMCAQRLSDYVAEVVEG